MSDDPRLAFITAEMPPAEGWELLPPGGLARVARFGPVVMVTLRLRVSADASFIGSGRSLAREVAPPLPVWARPPSLSIASAARTTGGVAMVGIPSSSYALQVLQGSGVWAAGDYLITSFSYETVNAPA